MASPAKLSLESASREDLVTFIRKVETRRRQVESKLKDEIVNRKAICEVLENNNLPCDDLDMLTASLQSNQLKSEQTTKLLTELSNEQQLKSQLVQENQKLQEMLQSPPSSDENQNLKKLLIEKDSTIQQLESQLTTQAQKTSETVASLQQQLEASQNNSSPNEIASLNQKIEELTTQSQLDADQISSLKEKVSANSNSSASSEDIEKKDQIIVQLENDVKTERARVQKLKQAYVKLRENSPATPRKEKVQGSDDSQEIQKLQDDLENAKQTITQLEEEVESSQQFAEQEIESLKEEFEEEKEKIRGNFQSKIEELQNTLDWKSEQLDSMQNEIDELEDENNKSKLALSKEIKNLNKKLKDLSGAPSDGTADIPSDSSKEKELLERIATLEHQLTEVQRECEEKHVHTVQKIELEHEDKHNSLIEEKEALKLATDEREAKLTNEISEAQKSLEATRAALADSEREIEQLRNDMGPRRDNEARIEELVAEIVEIRKSEEFAKSELANALEKLNAVEKTVKERDEALESLSQAEQTKTEEMNENLLVVTAELDTVKETLAQKQNECDTLEETNKQLSVALDQTAGDEDSKKQEILDSLTTLTHEKQALIESLQNLQSQFDSEQKRLTDEIQSLQEQNNETEQKLLDFTQQASTSEENFKKQLEEANQALVNARTSCENLEENKQELLEKLAQLALQNAQGLEQQELIKELQVSNDSLQEQLRTQAAQHNKTVDEIQEKLSELQEQNSVLLADSEKARAIADQTAQSSAENEATLLQFAALRDQHEELQSKHLVLEQKHSEVADKMKEQIDDLSKKNQVLQEESERVRDLADETARNASSNAETIVSRIQELQQQLDNVTQQRDEAINTVQAAQEENKTLQSSIADLETLQTALDNNVEESIVQNEKLQSATAEIAELKTKLTEMEEKQKIVETPADHSISRGLDFGGDTISTVDNDISLLQDENKAIKEENEKMKKQIENLITRQREREEDWKQRKEALTQAAEQVNKQRQTMLSATNEIEVRNNELAQKEHEIELRKQEIEKHDEEIRSLRETTILLTNREQELNENILQLEVKINKLKELYKTVKKQKDRSVQKCNETEIRLEEEIQNSQIRVDEAVENTRNILTQQFESNIEEFRQQIVLYEEKIGLQEEETRQLMVQYNSVLQSNSYEDEEKFDSLTETISTLQKQLHDVQKRASQVIYLEEECRTVVLQVKELEKQNNDLQNANAKLHSSMREQMSWKEQYDSLFIQYQNLLDEQSDVAQATEAANSVQFSELQLRLKEQRDLMQNLRTEKENITRTLEQQISTNLREIESLKKRLEVALNDKSTNINDFDPPVNESNPAVEETEEQGRSKNANLFFYNQVQNMKEKDIQESRKRIQELQEMLDETENHSQLYREQCERLKEEIRTLERSVTRDNGNMEYLKNVIVKYMETNDHEKLFPVISTILQFSPSETKRIQEAKQGVFGAWKLWK